MKLYLGLTLMWSATFLVIIIHFVILLTTLLILVELALLVLKRIIALPLFAVIIFTLSFVIRQFPKALKLFSKKHSSCSINISKVECNIDSSNCCVCNCICSPITVIHKYPTTVMHQNPTTVMHQNPTTVMHQHPKRWCINTQLKIR